MRLLRILIFQCYHNLPKLKFSIRKNIEDIQFYTKPWIIRIPVSSFVEFRYCEGIALLKKVLVVSRT